MKTFHVEVTNCGRLITNVPHLISGGATKVPFALGGTSRGALELGANILYAAGVASDADCLAMAADFCRTKLSTHKGHGLTLHKDEVLLWAIERGKAVRDQDLVDADIVPAAA